MALLLAWVLLPILLALSSVRGQSTQWVDPLTNIPFQRYTDSILNTTYSFIFPPLNPTSNEFIGVFTGPPSIGWLGVSLGGGMRSNLLLMAWLNGNTGMASPRYVDSYSSPAVISGPRVTVLGTSGVDSTQQRIVFRCQNCTTWTGGTGGINLNSAGHTIGLAVHGSIKPLDPADPNTDMYRHSLSGSFTLNTANAHSNSYNTYLSQLQNAPPLGGGTTPTPTTTTTPLPTSTANSCPGAPQPSYAMTVASGWRLLPVLGRLTMPRGITMDTAGNLIVVERGKGITGHTLNADGCVTSSKTILADTAVNHGIDFNPAGNQLYASSGDIAWVWDYNPSTMTATNRRTLVTGMYNWFHFTRTLLISKKNPNLLLVSVGSNSNIDTASYQIATGRASIKVFDLRTLPSGGTPYNSATYGKVMGYGLRNDVGVTQDRAGNIHSIENSLDDAYRTINGRNVDVHTNNPAEVVFNLGDPENPKSHFGGYPWCFTVWQPSDFTDKRFNVGDWFVQNPNGQYSDEWCNQNTHKPIAILPPHTAPLDMKFGLGNDTNMYAALHGSWNRQPPSGYKVVYIPGQFSAAGEWSPSTNLAGTKDAARDLLTNSRTESQCAGGCFRPVGLVFNPTGENLYVSSDTTGEVFMLKRNSGPVTNPGSPTSTTTTGPTSTPTLPTTTTTITSTTTVTSTPTPTTTNPSAPMQTLWGQCGGTGYTGPTQCPAGSACRAQNQWYSQCIPA